MLAVVEDEQHLAVPKVGRQDLQRLGRGLVSQVQRSDCCTRHERRVADLGEVDPPGSVREAAPEFCRRSKSEARLAHAARADKADEARLRERAAKLRQLPATAHEAGRLGGQIA